MDAAYGNEPRPVHFVPESVTNWLDDAPRLAVDKNNIPIVLHIPRWQRAKALVGDATPRQPPYSDIAKRVYSMTFA